MLSIENWKCQLILINCDKWKYYSSQWYVRSYEKWKDYNKSLIVAYLNDLFIVFVVIQIKALCSILCKCNWRKSIMQSFCQVIELKKWERNEVLTLVHQNIVISKLFQQRCHFEVLFFHDRKWVCSNLYLSLLNEFLSECL